MRIDIASRTQKTVLDETGATSGEFFSEVRALPAGTYKARFHVMFSPLSQGDAVTIRAFLLDRQEVLAETRLAADGAGSPDEIYLDFCLNEPGSVLMTGHVTGNCSTTLLRLITIAGSPDGKPVRKDTFFSPPTKMSIRRLKVITIGTTGVCNASCIHCPTNKPSRRMPHGRMSMELFSKIVDELAEGSFTGKILFGLFGEPLDDPFLIQRLKLIKEKLPKTEISMATNAGLFDPERHAEVIELADIIAVHVESVTPAVYDHLMHPLKAERVFPRILSLMKLAQAKGRNNITITAPTHKLNIFEADKIRQYFEPAGNFALEFTPMSNRAWNEGPFFDMALAPIGVACRPPQLTQQLIIDWDGALLTCCFDFSKSMILGNLSESTIMDVFASPAWAHHIGIFNRGEWSKSPACKQCRCDEDAAVTAMVTSLSSAARSSLLRFEGKSFGVTHRGSKDESGAITAIPEAEDGCVVYGPYIRLQTGRYRVYSSADVKAAESGATLLFDVCGRKSGRIATKYIKVSATGVVNGTLDFNLASADGHDLIEFRIWKQGNVSFVFQGLTVQRVGDLLQAEKPSRLRRLAGRVRLLTFLRSNTVSTLKGLLNKRGRG
jgi:pyruvate-formate lyase-activating enzyme